MQPQTHVADARPVVEALPPARPELQPLTVLQQDDAGARLVGRREVGLAERPGAVRAQVLDRAADVGVPDAALEELRHDRRLGDVLDAVDPRLVLGLRRRDVAAPRPLADRRPRDARERARLTGEQAPVRPACGHAHKDMRAR
jgi:hypothetical protein